MSAEPLVPEPVERLWSFRHPEQRHTLELQLISRADAVFELQLVRNGVPVSAWCELSRALAVDDGDRVRQFYAARGWTVAD